MISGKKRPAPLFVLFTLWLAALVLSACGDPTLPSNGNGSSTTRAGAVNTAQATGAKYKIAVIVPGAVKDGGWSASQDNARKNLDKQLSNVETTLVENINETPASFEKNVTDLILKGTNLIFTASPTYSDVTLNLAKKFPKVYFENGNGTKSADNVSTYVARDYQARYLAGIVAGKMTRSNIIGYVASAPRPDTISSINALTLGAQSVNPNIKVSVAWTNSLTDQTAATTAAEGLLSAGADVLVQQVEGTAVLQAAEKAGKFAIGSDTAQDNAAPKAYLTSTLQNWGQYYVDRAKAASGNNWKKQEYYGGLKEGVVDLAPLSSLVPGDVKTLVDTKKKALSGGEFEVFTGPIKDQSGAVKVAEGKKLGDAEIFQMDYFVQGVDGSLSKK